MIRNKLSKMSLVVTSICRTLEVFYSKIKLKNFKFILLNILNENIHNKNIKLIQKSLK